MISTWKHAESSRGIDKDRVFGDGSEYENQNDEDSAEVSGVEVIGDRNTLYEVILRKGMKTGQVQIVKTMAAELVHRQELLPGERNILVINLYENVSLDNKEFVKGELCYVSCHTKNKVQQGRGKGISVKCLQKSVLIIKARNWKILGKSTLSQVIKKIMQRLGKVLTIIASVKI